MNKSKEPIQVYAVRLMGIRLDDEGTIEKWGVIDLSDDSLVGHVTYADQQEAEDIVQWLTAAYFKGLTSAVVNGFEIVKSALDRQCREQADEQVTNYNPEKENTDDGID